VLRLPTEKVAPGEEQLQGFDPHVEQGLVGQVGQVAQGAYPTVCVTGTVVTVLQVLQPRPHSQSHRKLRQHRGFSTHTGWNVWTVTGL
jgi:hypothetical protein